MPKRQFIEDVGVAIGEIGDDNVRFSEPVDDLRRDLARLPDPVGTHWVFVPELHDGWPDYVLDPLV